MLWWRDLVTCLRCSLCDRTDHSVNELMSQRPNRESDRDLSTSIVKHKTRGTRLNEWGRVVVVSTVLYNAYAYFMILTGWSRHHYLPVSFRQPYRWVFWSDSTPKGVEASSVMWLAVMLFPAHIWYAYILLLHIYLMICCDSVAWYTYGWWSYGTRKTLIWAGALTHVRVVILRDT